MRTPPNWGSMTRDELEGHAAALWRVADTWLGGVVCGQVVLGGTGVSATEWNKRVAELREALK